MVEFEISWHRRQNYRHQMQAKSYYRQKVSQNFFGQLLNQNFFLYQWQENLLANDVLELFRHNC